MTRNDYLREIEEIVARAEREGRGLSDKEQALLDGLQLGLRRLELRDGSRSLPLSSEPVVKPAEYRERGIIGGLSTPEKLFGPPSDSRDLREHMRLVLERRLMSLGDGATGGLAMPMTWAAGFWAASSAESIFLPRCRLYDFGPGGELFITAWNDADQTAGPCGVGAQWASEGQGFDVATPKIRSIHLKPLKLGIFVDVTRELLQDVPALEQELALLLSKTAAWEFDRAIFAGSGIGRPTGILNASSTLTVNRASSGKIKLPDVVGMYSRLLPFFIRGAAWFASPGAMKELLQLENSAGNNVWHPPSGAGIAAAPAGTLLGLPLLVTDVASPLGERGDLVLANLAGYAVAVKQDVVVERSDSARWNEDIIAFRAIIRADGAPLLESPVRPANGGEPLSWAVVLGG